MHQLTILFMGAFRWILSTYTCMYPDHIKGFPSSTTNEWKFHQGIHPNLRYNTCSVHYITLCCMVSFCILGCNIYINYVVYSTFFSQPYLHEFYISPLFCLVSLSWCNMEIFVNQVERRVVLWYRFHSFIHSHR